MSTIGWINTIESLVKIVAILVGGWWTWAAFIRKRLHYPSADMVHVVTVWRDAGRIFIHLTIQVTNRGNVLLRIANGFAWLEQLSPLPQAIRESLDQDKDIVSAGRTDAEWSLIQRRDLPKGYLLEIEPGETDEILFDFVIDASVHRLLIYSHLANLKKETGGWNLNSIHEIPGESL